MRFEEPCGPTACLSGNLPYVLNLGKEYFEVVILSSQKELCAP
jgi:hypothetical protein